MTIVLPQSSLQRMILRIPYRAGVMAGEAFGVAHLAEHLLGRALRTVSWSLLCDGRVNQNELRLECAVTASREEIEQWLEQASQFETLPAFMLEQETAVIALEERVLADSLRACGRLPKTLPQLSAAWANIRGAHELTLAPYWPDSVRTCLAELEDGAYTAFDLPPDHSLESVPPCSEELAQEWRQALQKARRMTRQNVTLFQRAQPLRSFYNAESIVSAGLSCVDSPLQRRVRELCCLAYNVHCSHFFWRHYFYRALVVTPAVTTGVFREVLLPELIHALQAVDERALQTIALQGKLRVLTDAMQRSRPNDELSALARAKGFSVHRLTLCRQVAMTDQSAVELALKEFTQCLTREQMS